MNPKMGQGDLGDDAFSAGGGGEDGSQTGSLLADLRGGDRLPGDAVGALSASSKTRIPMQTIIIVVVMIAGAMALYGMRRYGMGAGMTFQTPLVQYDPNALAKFAPAEEKRVLAALESSGAPVQVPVEAIQKNPFQLVLGPALTQITTDLGPSLDREAERRRVEELARAAEREKLLTDAVGRLRVNGVIGGRVPLARVNGKLYRTGDVIQGLLTVESIDAMTRSVHLRADDKEFVISMIEDQGQSPMR